MLTLDHLEMRWGDWRLAANLTVPTGARVALIGPSGAGKSTLLAAIAGFQMPDAGRVLWDGEDLARKAPAERPVSILFQDNNLFPHLTASQNVGLGLRPDLKLNAEQRAQVKAALARVGLADLGARKPGQLSGGQAARVALARALLRQRPLMLLDEPFGALGPALRAEMLDLVAEIAGETGATLLIVSHDPDDAKRIAGQVIFVEGGKAQPPVDTAEIFAHPPPALTVYLGT